jgi:hypothetical protein
MSSSARSWVAPTRVECPLTCFRAPDIRVEILGNGFIGFELVCVDEPAYLRGLNLMPESARLLTDFYERRLSAGERSAFDERYRNAMLHVHFADTAGQRGVRRTLRPLFDALMRLPAGPQGPSLEDQLTRVDGVQYVYISRDESFSGPECQRRLNSDPISL